MAISNRSPYTAQSARTFLFIINGLGLGNSTRCHAVMEQMAYRGFAIHVLTSGNGLEYFKDKDCVTSLTEMDSLQYARKNGGISGWGTLTSLKTLLTAAKSKSRQLSRLLEQINPDVAIIDSEYSVAPLRKRGIPIVALNTSEMVVTQYLKSRAKSPSTRSHFWFVEFSDYLFHRHFCDLVLSPFPLRTPTRHPRFRRIGIIARKAILDCAPATTPAPFPSPKHLRRVLFMLSGSVHASNISLEQRDLPFKIDVVGRTGESRGNVTYHGRQMDNSALLASADALVINGGYSAVSEAFVLNKPVFVVPVPGHAEQFVNACLVQNFGLGFAASETDVLAKLMEMHRLDRWVDLKTQPSRFEIDGAMEAASALITGLKRIPLAFAGQRFRGACPDPQR